MRDLTQEEIDNAPDWAGYYFIDDVKGVIFRIDDYSSCTDSNRVDSVTESRGSVHFRPIKRYNIAEYEFSDKLPISVSPCGRVSVQVDFDRHQFCEITESDIDALKGHFVQMRGKNEI